MSRSVKLPARVHPTVVVAAVLPLLTVGALALVHPDGAPAERAAAPQEQPLHRAVLGCPADAGPIRVGAQHPGTVTVAGQEVAVRPHRGTAAGRPGEPGVVAGRADLASSLVAGRWRTKGLRALTCPATAASTWFTGLGAGAVHASRLSLTNPDQGSAVADITVLARTGPREVPALQGVTVPGGSTTTIDLAKVFPRRVQLAVRVDVPRGRLATSVLDVDAPIGTHRELTDWLPGQAEASEDLLLLGLAPGERRRDQLVLANTSQVEGRAEIRIVTKDASFVPEGQPEARLDPESVTKVALGVALRAALKDGAIGIEVRSTVPVTATLRSVVGGDLVHSAPAPASSSDPGTPPMSAFVPPGTGSVLLGQAGGVGTVQVRAYADGRLERRQTVEVTRGTGGAITLPRGTDYVEVEPRRTTVHASLLVAGGSGGSTGAVVLPFVPAQTVRLVPAVRPGLP